MLRSRRIQFRLCRPPVFCKLSVIPAADARDELSRRNGFCTLCDGLLKLRNGEGALDAPRFVAWIDACSGVVDVCIEEAWNHGASTEINRLCVWGELHRLTNSRDAPISNRDR